VELPGLEVKKRAGNDDLAVRLERDRRDPASGGPNLALGAKAPVERAVRLVADERETTVAGAGRNDLAVSLDRYRARRIPRRAP
jgi:hypothetical protein